MGSVLQYSFSTREASSVDGPSLTSPASRGFEQTVQVETPEHVVLSYSVAGVGSRALAALIDYALWLVTWMLIYNVLAPLFSRNAKGEAESAMGMWVLGLLILLTFGSLFGYYVLFEGLRDGQTPGKRFMNLRVVQDGGYSVSFAASAVRNIVRVVDMQPAFLYVVGMLSIIISRSGKRLGDILAGTMVVEERAVSLLAVSGVEGEQATIARPVALLTEDEYSLLDRFMARRQALDPERRRIFVEQMVQRFDKRLGEGEGTPAGRLVRLYERERSARAAGASARSDTGARREQHALVASGTARWRAFAERLRRVQQVGLAKLPEDEVSLFVAEYRELSTDLARLQTASRGRQVDALFYLSRIVAGAHNLIYRQRGVSMLSAWHYVSRTIPRELRRSAAVVLLSAAILFVPAGIAYTTLLHHPERARELMSPGMIDRVENAVLRSREGSGYIDIPQADRPVAAGGIIANNVYITYGVFALGITAGIGTVFVLLFNGVVLGAFAGLYASTGEGAQLLAFVAPHGVLELGAVAIGGGAGLHLASALLLPGDMTRKEALLVRGRRAITLVACATLMLLVAGAIEGLISPRQWPLDWKLAVSAATAVLLALYATRGRGEDAPAEPAADQSDARALISR
jgi:uncharacterized membrane protein SpoIIM required for sporulation/uncharacterized RDD family membrane protein YckC